MFKRLITEDFVDLSIGRIYFKPLTNKILNNAYVLSTIKGSEVNNALFYLLVEKSLLMLSNRKYNRLSVSDGSKVRDKTISILSRYGIVFNDEISVADKEWFNDSMNDGLNRLAGSLK